MSKESYQGTRTGQDEYSDTGFSLRKVPGLASFQRIKGRRRGTPNTARTENRFRDHRRTLSSIREIGRKRRVGLRIASLGGVQEGDRSAEEGGQG